MTRRFSTAPWPPILKPLMWRAISGPAMHVLLKPNLLAARDPALAVTTHPELLAAVARWLRAHGISQITLADSPGGVYSAAMLRKLYAAWRPFAA